MQNELLWAIESYVYIKKEEKEKAIAALNKLKGSTILSTDDKKIIDDAIVYLQNREKSKTSNKVFDKLFLYKIASQYMFNTLSKVDWKAYLTEKKVPYVQEMFESLNSINDFIAVFKKYTNAESVNSTGNDLKEKGKGLLDQAKELVK